MTVKGPWTDALRGGARSPLSRAVTGQLATRRWFRDKSRRIRATEVCDYLPVPSAAGPGAPVVGYLVVVRVALDSGLPETYVLPLAHAVDDAAAEVRKWRADSIAAEISSADGDGVIYDALGDAEFARALVDLMGRRRQLSGRSLRLAGVPARALRRLRQSIDVESPVVPITSEQSNTSVIIGNQVILKLIRRVEEGRNPDVEVGRYLTEHAGFEHSPAVGGSLELRAGPQDDEAATIAVLQEFVVNEGDGWSYVLDALSRVLEEAIARPDPAELDLDLPAHPLAAAALPPAHGHFLVGPQLQWAEALGRRTAEMHLALAADRSDDAFAPVPLTAVDRRSLHHGARSLLRQSLRAAQSVREPSECLTELLDRQAEVFDRLQTISAQPIVAQRIRCHGDYHLGQVLWTGKDFVIIDFEGEPARTLSSRRQKRPALVDVAGMIRSFHYASRAAGNRLARDLLQSREPASLEPLLSLWYRAVSGAFLRSYLAAAEDGAFLPKEPGQLGALLDFLLLEKAIYELGYEANNRPDWVDIPAQGLLDLLAVAGAAG
ncbi:MAG TPA: putative maltokinase [Mycobacteriales bacterium]|nr:putative maltokinase [Mycobacteriales bacterium]